MRSFTAFSDQDQEAVWKILQSTVKFKMSHIDAKLLIFPALTQMGCFDLSFLKLLQTKNPQT